MQTLQSTEILILDLFFQWKYEKKTQTWDTAQIEQTVKIMFSSMASRPTVYKIGLFCYNSRYEDSFWFKAVP